MSRIIIILELVLGVLALSIYSSGGDILLFTALSPFLLIIFFPVIAALAIWPMNILVKTFQDVFNSDPLRRIDPQSERILDFCRKISIIGMSIGLTVGLVILLQNTDKLTMERIYSIVSHAVTGVIAALAIAILLKQMSGIFRKKSAMLKEKNYLKSDSIRQICDRYGITNREREIIKMIAGGSSNREISRVLDITDDTVKNHVYNIFRKTGVKNRNGLVGMLLEMKK